ncbi:MULTISPECIES: family 43 glycosylhydrolase [Paenibacillus]|uniref:family 43 glycosylhydrolase n=1 Tax=Paenibacillus TaxID=44249 RepID=UPI0022B85909|nr:family 43 glycosylhydrolase [Paenibacillus caseinilyticus]MCZ8520768.1 family 43 glycosylhydrolase [Paenibacillus caseinilyticus]
MNTVLKAPTRKVRIHLFKKAIILLAAFTLLLNFAPSTYSYANQAADTYENPMIWADVPDPDVIRVGDAYYMTSTTMHMNPGVPIMKSYDLIHWEIVNYVYDILTDHDEQRLSNGKSDYGKGSWASSIRYNKGKYYVTFSSLTTRKTYIYQTEDIEHGPWTRSTLDFHHDMSLLFDDDGRVYLVDGSGDIRITELNSDATAVKEGGLSKVIIPNASQTAGPNIGLPAEGSHIQKINGKYYVFLITWPKGGMRTELVFRSDRIDGPYEGKVALSDAGVAQGGIIDTVDGNWYGLLFQDHGSVGRIPFLVPVKWEDGWPVFGVDGKVPASMRLPVPAPAGESRSRITASDEFYQNPKRVNAYHTQPDDTAQASAVQSSTAASGGKELIDNGGMEAGLAPWSANGAAAVALTQEEFNSGSNGLHVTGRKLTGDGPKQVITGEVSAGVTYKFSAKVKYTEGPDQKQFNFDIQNGPSWQGIKVLGSATLKKGEWGTIEGSYTLPSDADLSETFIFVETPWSAAPDPVSDLMNFYVDDISFSASSDSVLEGRAHGENDYNGSNLDLVWQWNHNPDNTLWSLTERPGYLRLTNGRKSTDLLGARNTLTQRTFGPESSGNIAVDVSRLKDGDYAGLAALQKDYGFVGVKVSGKSKSIVMVNGSSGSPEEIASVPLTQDRVYFNIDFDYKNGTDKAYFYYSLDGVQWTAIGNTLQMKYKLDHFMGYRFALFNYATKTTGGFADFDYFRIDDKLAGTNSTAKILKAALGDVPSVIGVPNAELEVPVNMEALPAGEYSEISASLNIPKYLTVTGVEFNSGNITGHSSYTYSNHRLQLTVGGANAGFSNQSSDLFATIKLKVEELVPEDQTAVIQTDYIHVTGGNAVYNVHAAAANIGLKKLDTGAIAKIPGYSNPLMSHKLGADPFALVHDGRVYIYMSSDEYEYDGSGKIKDNSFSNLNRVFVISSADMVNWTDHGAIPVAGPSGIAKWAKFSWAPAAAHKKINGADKFFLYFANGAGGIGVLTADSPIGPWSDPLGQALVTGRTPGVPGVVWLFDPAVLVDDDGSGYLYFGGGIPGEPNSTPEQIAHPKTSRVIKLADDMIHTVGSASEIDAPYMFEDSGIHKYNGTYYYSYCSNFAGIHPDGTPPPGEIAYMVSDNPMGPFTYVSPILKNPYEFFGVGGNNHHAIFQFNDQWYVVYHAQTVSKEILGDGKGYRSPHINKVEFYENGYMKEIKGDREGISQTANLDPYKRVEAETIAWSAGIRTEKSTAPGSPVESNNLDVTDTNDGDWVAVANADFGDNGAASFEAHVASMSGGKIELRLDSPVGEVIGTLDVTPTGGNQEWKLMNTAVSHVKGIHNVFFTFVGEGTGSLLNLDYWQFKAGDAEPALESVHILGAEPSLQVNEIRTVSSAVYPATVSNRTYHWEAAGSISIVGDSSQDSVTLKGESAGTGTLTLTVTAGGVEKKAGTEVTVVPDSQTASYRLAGPSSVKPGDSFDLTYGLSNVTQRVYAASLTVNYDPAALEYVEASSLLDGFAVVGSAKSPGVVKLIEAGTSSNRSVTGTLDLLSLKFRALNQTVTTNVYVTGVVLADQYGNEYPLCSGSGHTIHIGVTVPADKTELTALLTEAAAAAANAKVLDPVSPRFGYYPQSAVDALNASIAEADTVRSDASASQSQVDQARDVLAQALSEFRTKANQTASVGDLAIVSAHYHATSSDVQWESLRMYDLNKDSKLDIMDLAAMAARILN